MRFGKGEMVFIISEITRRATNVAEVYLNSVSSNGTGQLRMSSRNKVRSMGSFHTHPQWSPEFFSLHYGYLTMSSNEKKLIACGV